MTVAELYEQNFRFVWRVLRRLGVSEADVPDAVQDVFIVVHRKLASYEERGSVRTWLVAICMRVASDRRRLAHVRRHVLDSDSLERCADSGSDGDEVTDRREGLALLETILDELPLEQRAVFALFELEGYSGEEIATLLSVPLGTVYSRLRLARQAFRSHVGRRRAQSFPRLPRAGGLR
jgi:RNA polymerase sigma-70 factor (ECF subfamily)